MAWVKIKSGITPTPFVPQFSETLIAENPNLESSITFTQSWESFDLLKIEVADRDYTSNDNNIYYVSPSQVSNIKTVDGKMRLFPCDRLNRPGTYGRVTTYTISSSTKWSEFATNAGKVVKVYGLTCTNGTKTETAIFNPGTLTNVENTITYNTGSLYDDFDLILITTNPGNYTRCYVCYSIISPLDSRTSFKDKTKLIIDDVGESGSSYGPQITMSEHGMSAAKYLFVTGIKFTPNNNGGGN